MGNNWQIEWDGMCEYSNDRISVPEIVVTFKFRNKKDFEHFHNVIKEHLYDGEKVFDGMQRKDKKTAWYPPTEKASNFRYE